MARQTTARTKQVFTFLAPGAGSVLLVGDFTDWERNPLALRRLKDGTWKTTVPLEPGEHEYRFLVDGQWTDDPQCAVRRPNAFGAQNCVVEVR